jgi:hypothetical protein
LILGLFCNTDDTTPNPELPKKRPALSIINKIIKILYLHVIYIFILVYIVIILYTITVII